MWLVAEKYCEMLTRVLALDDVNTVFNEEANSRASVLAELLVADRDLKLARLVSDQIMMPPIALRSGVVRQRCMIDPRPDDTPPYVQIWAASIEFGSKHHAQPRATLHLPLARWCC